MQWAFRHVTGELCPRLGVRFVTVDALYDPDSNYDTAPFYTRFGFTFADGEGGASKASRFARCISTSSRFSTRSHRLRERFHRDWWVCSSIKSKTACRAVNNCECFDKG